MGLGGVAIAVPPYVIHPKTAVLGRAGAGGCYWAGNKPALPVLTCFLRTARIDAST